MPARERFLGGVQEWRETASANNGVATATRAAEAGKRHYITGFSISASTAITAAGVVAQIRRNGGGTVIREFNIPNAAIAPIIYEFKQVLEIPTNQSADITLSALGTGITGRVELVGFTTPE